MIWYLVLGNKNFLIVCSFEKGNIFVSEILQSLPGFRIPLTTSSRWHTVPGGAWVTRTLCITNTLCTSVQTQKSVCRHKKSFCTWPMTQTSFIFKWFFYAVSASLVFWGPWELCLSHSSGLAVAQGLCAQTEKGRCQLSLAPAWWCFVNIGLAILLL